MACRQHGEAVLVDVLMPVMLVRLHPQPGHLGQHLRRRRRSAPGGRCPAPGPGASMSLVSSPATRSAETISQPRRLLGHGRPHLGRDGEPQLGREPGRAHDPERVVAEGVLRPSRGPQHPLPQRVQAAERVDQLVAGQPGRHRVDGEVAAAQVLLEGPPVPHVGLAGGGPVLLAAVGGDLEDRAALAQADGAESDPDRPDVVGPPADQRHDLLRAWRRWSGRDRRAARRGTRPGPGRRPGRARGRAARTGGRCRRPRGRSRSATRRPPSAVRWSWARPSRVSAKHRSGFNRQ